jgi:Ca2+-binding EF-hand superfamily protein
VQDHRILRRIAQDPETIGQVDLKRFCPRFETLHLRRMRLNKTLDKLATAFYLQSLNLKRAFEIFDVSGNGTINRREFRQGFNQLNLGLTFDEIDDLMSMMSSDPSAANEVSYDDFIQHLDDNIRKRSYALKENVEESIMARIKECLDYAGETLYESLKIYDLEDLNTINLSDLPRVFKRLGISNIDPHIPYLLRIGQVLDPR